MNPDVKRVYQNIAALLANGTYPGNAAEALAEAQHFVANILAKLDEPAPAAEAPVDDGQQAS